MTFKQITHFAVNRLRKLAPKDTRNLANNAIRYYYVNDTEAHIYVDTDIAPYMPYTNEPWVSQRWHGKKNPNLYWFDFAVQNIVREICAKTGGTAMESKSSTDMTPTAAERMYQNMTGDYFAPDFYIHSEYIANTPGVSFEERARMINN